MAQQMSLEQEKLALERHKLQMKENAEQDIVKQLKRYGEALSQVIGPQPVDVTDLPSYFSGVEQQFQQLKIPKQYQARLLYKHLSPSTRALCSRMEPVVRDDYERMKEAIMKEFGLTAKCFFGQIQFCEKGYN